jgi:hypothetical protein
MAFNKDRWGAFSTPLFMASLRIWYSPAWLDARAACAFFVVDNGTHHNIVNGLRLERQEEKGNCSSAMK